MDSILYLSVSLREVRTAEARLREAKTRVIAEQCPVKIGDVVECNGYSHKGKKFQVESIIAKDRSVWREEGEHSFEFCATGRIIKKNGESGEQKGEHTIKFTVPRAI